ncbi:MAG: hypothetical protein WBV96_08685 [Polyangia bacterium]
MEINLLILSGLLNKVAPAIRSKFVEDLKCVEQVRTSGRCIARKRFPEAIVREGLTLQSLVFTCRIENALPCRGSHCEQHRHVVKARWKHVYSTPIVAHRAQVGGDMEPRNRLANGVITSAPLSSSQVAASS